MFASRLTCATRLCEIVVSKGAVVTHPALDTRLTTTLTTDGLTNPCGLFTAHCMTVTCCKHDTINTVTWASESYLGTMVIICSATVYVLERICITTYISKIFWTMGQSDTCELKTTLPSLHNFGFYMVWSHFKINISQYNCYCYYII